MNELKKQQLLLPKKTGIYIFWKDSVPLYIGKAKNLYSRTGYYFKEDIPKRLIKMSSEANNLTFHLTETENDAFLLEAQFIKEKQPVYNILYKTGRTLYYILFSDHQFPSLQIIKEFQNGSFGPFLSYFIIKQLLDALLKIFKIRTCQDVVFAKRKRPCMEFHFNRCSAPCVKFISEIEYASSILNLKNLFKGKTQKVVKFLKQQLKEYVKKEDYEEAAKKRDQLYFLGKISQIQNIYFENIAILDIVVQFRNYFYVESIKKGAVSNIIYRKYEKRIELYQFLLEYYISEPRQKVIGMEDIKFGNYTNKMNSIEKKAYNAALQRLKNLVAEDDSKENWNQILKLKKMETIEAYDCSHYVGKFPLCGMIYATSEGEFVKNKYRVWKNEKETRNDLEILESALKRRFERGNFPDLILLDGGKTQLNVAKNALFPFKNILAFAKGEDRKGGILYNYEGQEVEIPKDLSLFLENLRTEAHRWAKKNANMRFSKKFIEDSEINY